MSVKKYTASETIEHTGTLPITINANGDYLADYRIYGASGGVGNEVPNIWTGNFSQFDDIGGSGNVYTYFALPNPCIIKMRAKAATTIPSDCYIGISVNGGDATGGISWLCSPGQTYTTGAEKKTALNESRFLSLFTKTQTAYDYFNENFDILIIDGAQDIPYGYEMDMSVSDGTTSTITPIYIGSDPLEADEYVDYAAGKIYRKKQVHTDTVTIDGIVWDILGYDHDTVYKNNGKLAQHSVTIQMHDGLRNMQFDQIESLFVFDTGLTAGTYNFVIGDNPKYSSDNGKTVEFTINNSLPNGGQLVIKSLLNNSFIGAKLSAFASAVSNVELFEVTLSEGGGGTALGTIGQSFLSDYGNNVSRAMIGNGRWSQSSLRQYLNSASLAGNIWTPQNRFDRPPSWVNSINGFLYDKSTDFKNVLGTTTKTTALNSICDGGGKETTNDKVFLLSKTEIYGGNEVTEGEGTAYDYYSAYSTLNAPGGNADSNRVKYLGANLTYWSLRTPNISYALANRIVKDGGSVSTIDVNMAISLIPACCIPLDDIGNNDWLREKFLKPIDPPVPLPALPTVNGTTIVDYDGVAKPSEMYIKYNSWSGWEPCAVKRYTAVGEQNNSTGIFTYKGLTLEKNRADIKATGTSTDIISSTDQFFKDNFSVLLEAGKTYTIFGQNMVVDDSYIDVRYRDSDDIITTIGYYELPNVVTITPSTDIYIYMGIGLSAGVQCSGGHFTVNFYRQAVWHDTPVYVRQNGVWVEQT